MAALSPEACAMLISSILNPSRMSSNLKYMLDIFVTGCETLSFIPILHSVAPPTCRAELRGAPAAPRWEDGHEALAEARASLLDAPAQAPESRVRLAAVGVLHAVDLTAHAGALHHVAACCTHGPAEHIIRKFSLGDVRQWRGGCEGVGAT